MFCPCCTISAPYTWCIAVGKLDYFPITSVSFARPERELAWRFASRLERRGSRGILLTGKLKHTPSRPSAARPPAASLAPCAAPAVHHPRWRGAADTGMCPYLRLRFSTRTRSTARLGEVYILFFFGIGA
eukprot:gene22325-biopygen7193